jgi:hypothetical protein
MKQMTFATATGFETVRKTTRPEVFLSEMTRVGALGHSLHRHRPRTVAPIPSSAAIWLTLTPGASSIDTASRLYPAENLRCSAMTPLLAPYEP